MDFRKDKSHSPNVSRSSVTSTTGSVMTKEVGSVTGELEVATRPLVAEAIEVMVRYAGADEWYTVEGSPIELGKVRGLPASKLRELHERLVKHLTTPRKVVDGNEQAISLLRFSLQNGDDEES